MRNRQGVHTTLVFTPFTKYVQLVAQGPLLIITLAPRSLSGLSNAVTMRWVHERAADISTLNVCLYLHHTQYGRRTSASDPLYLGDTSRFGGAARLLG